MNPHPRLIAAALLLAASLLVTSARAAEGEDGLIAVLQADKPAAEKAAACRGLKVSGTAKAVPALAPLLLDKDLSHWARIALESLPAPEAGAALREALGKTTGLVRVGIIDSIGARRDKAAVPALSDLVLKDADPMVGSAAAAALGRVGAVQELTRAVHQAPRAVRGAVVDALLVSADELRDAGNWRQAATIYELYDVSAQTDAQRAAMFRGQVMVAGPAGVRQMAKALAATNRTTMRVALELARTVPWKGATEELAGLVSELPPTTAVALIEALRQRGDPAAAPAILDATKNPAAEVRLAALTALGALGDATTAPVLADIAARATGAEQDAAREALFLLRDPKVADALLAALPKAAPAVGAEIVRALGARRDPQALPALMKLAQEGDDAARLLALQALAQLAPPQAAGDLTKLLLAAKADAPRDAAEQALLAACLRATPPETAAPGLIQALKDAGPAPRAALLRVLGRLGGEPALDALRAAVQDQDAAVQNAAVRALADYPTLDAAPDLLKLAREAAQPAQRVLALRGYWRLVAGAGERPLTQRWQLCEAGLAAATRPEEKKLGLTELAKLPHVAALALAEKLAGNAAVRGEAEAAAVQIALSLAGSQPTEAKAALGRLAAGAGSDAVRADAKKALDSLDQFAGYITTFLAAGPYRQAGKQCQELFDIPFGPEPGAPAPADGKPLTWKPAPHPADPALFYQADLLPLCDGEQCVIYLKARVVSPRAQKVRLDIGSDDGIKLWLNGKLVHAHNVLRPIKPGDDHAEAELKEGANDFFLKITQNNMGCAVCVRLRQPDGGVVEGLRFETQE